MIPVTQAYLEAIRAPVRTDSVEGELTMPDGTTTALTAADFMSGTLTIDDQCVSGEELMFGCVYLGQASLTLKTAIDRYTLYNAVLKLRYTIQLADGSTFTVPLGVYNITEAERTGGNVTIKAYDNAVLLDKSFDGEALQGTPYEMLCQVAERCGLAMGQTADELAKYCNSGEMFQLVAGEECATYRDCVSAIAQVLAGFGTVDRDGALVIRQFAQTPCTTLTPAERCTTTVADYHCCYDSLAVDADSGSYTAETETPNGGLQLLMDDVPLLNRGLTGRNQQLVDAMFGVLSGINYTPATVTMPGDPALECGDRVTLRQTGRAGTGKNDDDIEMLITHRVWKYHARQSIRAAGRNPRLAKSNQKESATVRKLQSQTEKNKLIFYSFTNPAPVTLSDTTEDGTLAKITFVTVANTSAMFLAQLLFTATPQGQNPVLLTLKYYLGGSLIEDYTPQQSLAAGRHTLALFYPFASLAAGTAATLELRAEVEGGRVHFETGAVRATVTGQGMSETEVWDGTISVEETLPAMTYDDRQSLLVVMPTDEMTLGMDVPRGIDWNDTLALMRWQTPVMEITPPTEDLPTVRTTPTPTPAP